MGKPLIPIKDKEEAVKRYLDGDAKYLTEHYGFKNEASLSRCMRERFGVKISEQPLPFEPEVEKIPYPDFKIKPFVAQVKSRDKEDIDIKIADAHLGKKTETYNLKIAEKRFDHYLSKVMRIIELHRPIGKAHISLLGDNVQGENIYQGSNVEETECGVWEQINDYAIPILSRFILSLAQGVEEVEVHGVPGNHGKYNKESTPNSNWDNFVYKGLETALQNQKRITVHCPTTFYQIYYLQGFKHFIFHGDQVRMTSGIPLFAMKRKLQEWFAYVGRFAYAYAGHFHSWGADQVNAVADYQLSPPFVTGDEWALQVVGRASKPVQLVCGIHPKIGRSFQYHLFTDDEYLPQPEISDNIC